MYLRHICIITTKSLSTDTDLTPRTLEMNQPVLDVIFEVIYLIYLVLSYVLFYRLM